MDTDRRLGAHPARRSRARVSGIFGNLGTTELPLMDALIGRQTITTSWGFRKPGGGDGRRLCAGLGQARLHQPAHRWRLGHGLGSLLNACTSGTPLVVTAGQQDSRHAISDPLLQAIWSPSRPRLRNGRWRCPPRADPDPDQAGLQDSHATPSGPVFLSLPMNVAEAMSEVEIPKVSRVDRRPVASSLPELAKELAAYAPGRWRSLRATRSRCTTPARRWWNSPSSSPRRYSARPASPHSLPHQPLPVAGNLPTMRRRSPKRSRMPTACSRSAASPSSPSCITDASALPAGCELYQLSVDGNDLGRTYPTKYSPVVGDIQYSLKQLNLLLRAQVAGRQADFEAQRERAREARRHAGRRSWPRPMRSSTGP